ncbi:unnamed protein product [marine sediment metagenome]|uniref:Uncharacterized protein n=1 Tax=marine sediment metagenome TaxID=412755 RepID=X1AZS0_9ZZZZ
MTAINMGSTASDRPGTVTAANTWILKDNPAGATGKIARVDIWANTNLTSCDVGIFYIISGTNFTTRDSKALGAITGGLKQTFVVDLDVVTGDYLGIYWTISANAIEYSETGASGMWYKSGDYIPCTNEEFSDYIHSAATISVYGRGATLEYNYFGYNSS